MPIRKYVAGAAFDPAQINVMNTALEEIQAAMNLKSPEDPFAEIIAKKVVSLASQGILDPGEIKRRVMADIK